ncbi:MAG: hypothetical protein AB7K37_12455 [Cyclobacteriaceae bacterium]
MKTLKRLITAFFIGLLFYFSFGFFVIQPIGAIPDGATVLYFRLGLNVTFISSADGILLDNEQDVSLLGRMIILGKFGEIVKERKIVSLPYSRTLYLISTGGKEFEK